jgi:uncharacterized membrane protein
MSESVQEPIEDYLDELLSRLQVPPRQTRRLLAETEDHLRETAERLEQQGYNMVAAESEAVRQFGSPDEVAAAERRVARPSTRQTVTAIGQGLVLLAGLGLTAIGASGVLAWAINMFAGPRFVGAVPQTYSAALCRYYLFVHPAAITCPQAAAWENSQDAASLRLLAGMVGLLLLGARWLWRRTDRPAGALVAVSGLATGLAALAFAGAAAFLGGQAIDLAVQHGSGGVGWYLTGAIVAAIAIIPCVISTRRSIKPVIKVSYAFTPLHTVR